MKKIYSILLTLLTLAIVSCQKNEIDEPVINPDSFSMTIDVEELSSRVTYTDDIAGAFNPNADKLKNNISLAWREGDELVAIRWKAPYNEYAVLRAEPVERDQSHTMSFNSIETHFTSLEEGEKFVLVHGDFVLDPDSSGKPQSPKIDFPTSEVTKAGYGSYIHHGGVRVDDKGDESATGANLKFRDQDGTLNNLRKHEYMVADAHLHIVSEEEGHKSVILYSTTREEGGLTIYEPVTMHSAHTLLRLTLFIPDEDFEGQDNKLFAISLKEKELNPIFHRYFRMEPNYEYRTSYNDHSDKESNSYYRLNLPEEGWNHTETNILKSNTFDPSKMVSVEGTVSGKTGHYVTAYISLPPKNIGQDDQSPSELVTTFFTRTHAYRSGKTYKIPAEAMQRGIVYPLNISFARTDCLKIKAITDPVLKMTFAPGIVYAHRANESADWEYSIYQNQGEYGGIDQQSAIYGDYFCFGSINPNEVFHKHPGSSTECPIHTNYKNNVASIKNLTSANDAAAKVVVTATDGTKINNVFSSMSKQEAERVFAKLQDEIKKGVNKGFYYYEPRTIVGAHHTAHQSVGAHVKLPAGDLRRQMSSTIGIWIGISTQPSIENQDEYVFIPSSNQLNNATNNMTEYINSEGIKYYAGSDFGAQRAGHRDSEADGYIEIPEGKGHWYLKSDLDSQTKFDQVTMKFSTNTRENASNANCYRFQLWYKSGNSFSSSGIASMDKTFGRVIRPVIY